VNKLASFKRSKQLTTALKPFYGAHGRPQGGKQTFAIPGNWDEEPKISNKPEISSLIPIDLFNSCNDSLFADMTLTLHTSQIHCFA